MPSASIRPSGSRPLLVQRSFTYCIKSSPVWRVTSSGYDRIEKGCADQAENKLRLRTLILKVGEGEFQVARPAPCSGWAKKISVVEPSVISPSVSHLSLM